MKRNTSGGTQMTGNALEWDYGQTPVTFEDVVEAIAHHHRDKDWEVVSARMSYLEPEVFCEKHGQWEPEDSGCCGAVTRMRVVDRYDGPDAPVLSPALLTR